MALAYTHLDDADGYQVKTGIGILHTLVFNTPVSGATINVYNGTANTDPAIALITMTADVKPFYLKYDCRFSAGLFIETDEAALDITVVYQ